MCPVSDTPVIYHTKWCHFSGISSQKKTGKEHFSSTPSTYMLFILSVYSVCVYACWCTCRSPCLDLSVYVHVCLLCTYQLCKATYMYLCSSSSHHHHKYITSFSTIIIPHACSFLFYHPGCGLSLPIVHLVHRVICTLIGFLENFMFM